ENSLIYIQPLYLKAEDGRIPELKRVIVGYQNTIAMGLDLEDALAQIFGGDGGRAPAVAAPAAGATPSAQASAARTQRAETFAGRARTQFRELSEAAGQNDWERFGRALDALGRTLEEMARQQR
ncbi:MAG: hypothetical protein GWO16_15595, partial [Gammaproteobacteria bacterium]|nr:hypothetical protein [Gammaproteobacteria bacterium]